MAEIYIYSTLSASVAYEADGGREILISGGANVPSKHFVTPQGVVTTVTEEDLAQLKKNRVFELHSKNGFIKWHGKKLEVEAVIAEMQGADDSAPDGEAEAEVVQVKTGTKTRARKDA